MFMFVWEDVLCDYTCGMVCVLARTVDEALELVKKKGEWEYKEIKNKTPKVISKPEAFISYGGG